LLHLGVNVATAIIVLHFYGLDCLQIMMSQISGK